MKGENQKVKGIKKNVEQKVLMNTDFVAME